MGDFHLGILSDFGSGGDGGGGGGGVQGLLIGHHRGLEWLGNEMETWGVFYMNQGTLLKLYIWRI